MKRLVASTLVVIAVVAAAAAQADPANYGIDSVSASLSSPQAGAHADFSTSIVLKTENFELPALTRDVSVELPPGLLANPNAVPRCSAAQFVTTDVEEKSNASGCPQNSQVGVTHIVFSNEHEGTASFVEPVFNLVPRPGEPARLGFIALQYPILIDTELRPDYGVTAMVKGADTLATLYTTETTLWGVPADGSHDSERMTPYESAHNRGGIETPTGTRSSGLTPTPYMVNPTQCGGPLSIRATAVSYQLPNVLSEGSGLLPGMTGCSLLDFKPDLSITPSTDQASSGSGLSVKLAFPTGGFEDAKLFAEAGLRRAEVVLPEGLTINPSQANGLSACSEADFAQETATSGPGEGCPESSKIGTATARSPLLEEEAEGALYVATPHANPFGSLIALYLVLRVPERGVVVKLAGRVEPDPNTGRLVSIFGDPPYEIPQLPVSSFELRFREGARAPLVTPSRCGDYVGTATFTSWAGQVAIAHPSFRITGGHGGGACPSGEPAFSPRFSAGTRSNNAASYSPLIMQMTREDGEQELARFSVRLPHGLVAKLAGTSECPESAIELARTKTGLTELASPSCPASSEIGDLLTGAGVGPAPTYVKGKLYLSGPYLNAPLSVIAIVPAVAGPFDLGTVALHEPLRVDPRTAVVEGGGPEGDPIPRMLEGIPLAVRDVRLDFDRPSFTLNPTSCDPSAFRAMLWGAGGDVFNPVDDSPVSLDDRFQAANCLRLPFKPELALKLFGETRRGGNPRLRAVLKMRRHSANIKGASVALPHSEFLDQSHIQTICTRVQFAANNCPSAAVYGHATAKTPLLDQPLRGPVYLRSSNHELPDLVADLRGQIHITLVGRIDSVRGGIRTTFSAVPDAPVSSFVLTMYGGKKGLLENSRDICRTPGRASVRFSGQNGKFSDLASVVNADCGKERSAHGK
jgi:hypothetical protein